MRWEHGWVNNLVGTARNILEADYPSLDDTLGVTADGLAAPGQVRFGCHCCQITACLRSVVAGQRR